MIDRFFKDKNGRVALWQWPNIYLWIWFGLWVLGKIIDDDFRREVQIAANATLLIWAVLEIFKGDSYFRRLLGVIVAAATIIWFIRTING